MENFIFCAMKIQLHLILKLKTKNDFEYFSVSSFSHRRYQNDFLVRFQAPTLHLYRRKLNSSQVLFKFLMWRFNPKADFSLTKYRVEACNFIGKRLRKWCFPLNFVKYLREHLRATASVYFEDFAQMLISLLFFRKICRSTFFSFSKSFTSIFNSFSFLLPVN